METINITELVQAIITIIAAIISIFVIPFIKGKVGDQNMTEFLRWVDIAVAAAEQLYDSTQGAKKKRYVLSYLETKGFTIAEEDMDLAIEAAVNRLHNELYGTSLLIAGSPVEVGNAEDGEVNA